MIVDVEKKGESFRTVVLSGTKRISWSSLMDLEEAMSECQKKVKSLVGGPHQYGPNYRYYLIRR